MKVDRNISEFKRDLLKLKDYELFLKYIYSSEIWYFKEYKGLKGDLYFEAVDRLYKNVSESFGVNFKNILVVGSGKTGFSLNPKKKFLRGFDEDENNSSDLDVALVSNELFCKYWRMLREFSSVSLMTYYPTISSSIYNGYISHMALENIPELRREHRELKQKSNRLLRADLEVSHEVKYRIYRSWADVQDYHIGGINKIRKGAHK